MVLHLRPVLVFSSTTGMEHTGSPKTNIRSRCRMPRFHRFGGTASFRLVPSPLIPSHRVNLILSFSPPSLSPVPRSVPAAAALWLPAEAGKRRRRRQAAAAGREQRRRRRRRQAAAAAAEASGGGRQGAAAAAGREQRRRRRRRQAAAAAAEASSGGRQGGAAAGSGSSGGGRELRRQLGADEPATPSDHTQLRFSAR
jgi:hypothetical protein